MLWKDPMQLQTIIGGKKILISIELVEAEIPLLVCANATEKGGAVFLFLATYWTSL